ncbi:MAG: hypothetical protein ABJF10_08615 [Chthoniobacter sp.]
MTTTLRLLAITALALSLPACASAPKKSASCCAAGDSSCKAPMAKKKAN